MTSDDTNKARLRGWIKVLLFPFVLLLLTAIPARAQSSWECVADFGGLLDGNVTPPPNGHLDIDGPCTIRNYPASNPFTANISFFGGTGPGLVVFDNVVFTGNVSCNNVAGWVLWFTNGSTSDLKPDCQNLLIPVEKINKLNPPGPATATIGVPFTYTLTIPVLFDPKTGTVINSSGSANDLHSIKVTDDLNATGANLSYVSHTITWVDDGTAVPHNFTNVGGLLTFDSFPVVPAGRQFVISITVVLNDVPANVPGTQFINTAKWEFGRLIDGVFYSPLPGEWGVTPPMTISAPVLVTTKSGPATMNLGALGDFALDVQNTGLIDAWNVTLRDQLPDGPTGGMCDQTPVIVSARVFASDGVTPVPGKGPLSQGTDYSMSYSAAPNCRLDLTMLTAAGRIGPNERLIVRYRTRLDAGTQNSITLTNVAGAIEWFNGDISNPARVAYNRTLTNGTPGILDHEDAHTVTVALTGYFFEKTVADLTSGANPALTARRGDTLRYSLRFRTTNLPLTNFRVFDDLDALNAQPAFAPGSLVLVSYPAGADISATSSTGGSKGTGVIDIRNLNLPADSLLLIQFDIRLDSIYGNGTVIANQSTVRLSDGSVFAVSDDPNVNGPADPSVIGDEDPTRVSIAATGYVFEKTVADLTSGASPATTAAPGDTLRYTLRFRGTNQPLSNFRIHDEMDALNAAAAFVPGTLTLVSYPAGADVSGTNSTGGAKGTGIIDIRNLNVLPGADALIQFDIKLASPLANGIVVTNQSTLNTADGSPFAVSDDPNVNGPASPSVAGDEDPTRLTIFSAPVFRIQKISTDLTGDPNILLAGETLRYTITVKNIGNAPAVNVTLRDAVPVNTTYVAGSTTLNGAAIPDVGGLSPLATGMLINSPADTTPGSMPADPSSNPANVATIRFDVVVSPSAVDGTVISNQGFVSAISSGIADQPSDDPDTPIANDPTRDIVGNLPLLYAEKRAALLVDNGSPGIIDAGDVMRYTITVANSATVAATGVVLRDAVPANTTYVANSTLLNGAPVGQPDGGVSPLASGITAGTIAAGARVVLQFDLRINAGTPAGTLISNQAVVDSVELPDLLTDGDGNPATGPEPTVVVVGAAQQLSITKQVTVVGGGAALPGAQLEYLVRVVNISSVPVTSVVITDNLDASQPGQLSYVNGSAVMNGSAAGVTFSGTTITANYSAVNGQLNPGEVVTLRFRATLAPGLLDGTLVTNTGVVAWNTPTQTASAAVSVAVGGIPGVASLNGSVWHDADFDDTKDSTERTLAGWTADLYRDGVLVISALTDAAGVYRISGIAPNDVSGSVLELRFRAPGAGPTTAMLGRTVSPFTNGLQRITNIVVSSGSNVQNLNLPIHPNGVIYNSLSRTPVAGVALTLMDGAGVLPLPSSCFDDATQQGQITLADGYYKFDVNFSNPACQSGSDYLIAVTAPAGGTFVAGYSQIIPPTSSASTAAFSVPSCPASPNDAVPATATYCEAQISEFAPATSVAPRSAGTTYHVHLRLDGSQMPGSSQIFNNHIPLDPQLAGSVAISKTTPLRNVTRGQLVPYVITVNNIGGMLLSGVTVVDRVPAGFTYVPGSALLDGAPTEPSAAGQELDWNGLTFAGMQVRTLKLLLAVGAGVSEGEYVNRAQVVLGVTGGAISGEATATVRIVPDPTFDCTDVTGKVFNDANRNGRQDDGETGLPGVRVVTAQGLQATTDQYGRYHITCAITPNENRGSNFVLKLDDRTLPSGFRMTTDQVQVQRATRGKALKLNFGASIHRVVGIDISDAVFEPGTAQIRVQWRPRMDILLDELRKAPGVLRLSYVADTEDAALVEKRMETVKRQLTEAWKATNNRDALTIEPEVFWRLGAPPKRPEVRAPKSR